MDGLPNERVEKKLKKKRKRAALPVIGWREWLSMPGLGIERIRVKVDTGARSSALHASDIELVRRAGRELVRFKVAPVERDERTIQVEAPLLEMRRVRNSSGKVELRPVIVTSVCLMEQDWPIELSLTRRDMMGCRMLLGREAVRGRFTIDPSRSYYDKRLRQAKRTRFKGRDR